MLFRSLRANTTDSEISAVNFSGAGLNGYIDILSNGFKLRGSATDLNSNTNTLIYAAFAESPLVGTNNVPTTAR